MHVFKRGLCCRSLGQTLVKAVNHQTRTFQRFYWSPRGGKGYNQERRLERKSSIASSPSSGVTELCI